VAGGVDGGLPFDLPFLMDEAGSSSHPTLTMLDGDDELSYAPGPTGSIPAVELERIANLAGRRLGSPV
jgi:hypothetical protein